MDAAAAAQGDGDDVQQEPADGGDVVEQQNMAAWVLPPDDERGSWEVGSIFSIDFSIQLILKQTTTPIKRLNGESYSLSISAIF